ncbi:hypothetical protein Bbelb_351200 [Branchiostoma belcheri]|nr:hypothetical protein Bbelb_351200 [Branchiostoma belcheri]
MHGIGKREKRRWGQNRLQENVNTDSSDTGFSDSESDITGVMSAKALQECLKKELHGIKRPPASLFNCTGTWLETLHLDKYEVLSCEALHDNPHHVQNFFDELPLHVPADICHEIKQVYKATLGNRESLLTSAHHGPDTCAPAVTPDTWTELGEDAHVASLSPLFSTHHPPTPATEDLGPLLKMIRQADEATNIDKHIVYVGKKQKCMDAWSLLTVACQSTTRGVVRAFHADMSPKAMDDILQGFREGRIRIIVATVAFGMRGQKAMLPLITLILLILGIDVPDVNGVVVYGNVDETYQNDKHAKAFAMYIHESMFATVKSAVDDAEFFSILSDGSTDVQEEIVYVKVLENFRPVIKFVALKPLQKADAESITRELVEVVEQDLGKTDWRDKPCAAGVDGANVMLGHVATGPALDCPALKPVSTVGTRWIGHTERALSVVDKSFLAIITHLEQVAQGTGESKDKARQEMEEDGGDGICITTDARHAHRKNSYRSHILALGYKRM